MIMMVYSQKPLPPNISVGSVSRMQVEEIVGDSVKLLWPSYIAGKRIT